MVACSELSLLAGQGDAEGGTPAPPPAPEEAAAAAAPARRFILVTSAARVGSNWARSLLNQHPQLHMEGEVLSITSYRARFNFSFGLDAALDAAFGAAEAAARPLGKRTVGWKAGGPEMTTVCNCTPRALLTAARARFGTAVLYLHREDFTAVALSLEIARRSQVYVLSRAKAMRERPRINISSVPAFVRKVRGFASHAAELAAMLDAHVRPHLPVAYEALYRDPVREAARVFAHLRVPPCEVAASATTRKLGASSFRESVVNWQELCEALDEAGLRTPVWYASCE